MFLQNLKSVFVKAAVLIAVIVGTYYLFTEYLPQAFKELPERAFQMNWGKQ